MALGCAQMVPQRSGGKLVLPSHSTSDHQPSRSSLPLSTSDGFTRGARPVVAENLQHLGHTPPQDTTMADLVDAATLELTAACLGVTQRRWATYIHPRVRAKGPIRERQRGPECLEPG